MIRYTIVRVGPPRAYLYYWRIRKGGKVLQESMFTYKSKWAAFANLCTVVTLRMPIYENVTLEVKP